MTRTQAWRKVAEAFGTPREKRTEDQLSITRHGLCAALDCFPSRSDPYRQLYALIQAMGHDWIDWWPYTRRGDVERAFFAGLMAAMTQRERDQLEPGL